MQKICWLAFIYFFAFSTICTAQTQLKMEIERTDECSFTLHTNKRLGNDNIDFLCPAYRIPNQPEWVKQVFQVEGVTRVDVNQYQARVFFAKLFDGDKISVCVQEIVKKTFGQLKL